MRALPALAEADLQNFGQAITEIQRRVGDHFAPAQGGRFTSPRVAAMLHHFDELGATCLGQTSWGPTGFVVTDGEDAAQALLREARARWGSDASSCELRIVAARNRGADRWVSAAPHPVWGAPCAPDPAGGA
jgi:predicted sugar kinase